MEEDQIHFDKESQQASPVAPELKRPGLRIDMQGKEWKPEMIDKEELQKAGFIIYENARLSSNTENSSLVAYGARKGTQFPHRDVGLMNAEGQTYPDQEYRPVDVLLLASTDKVPKLDPNYHEPFTFIGDPEEIFQEFLKFLAAKGKDTETWGNARFSNIKHIQKLREDIKNLGIENVGNADTDITLGLRAFSGTWKEAFLNGFLIQGSVQGENRQPFGRLTFEEMREWMMHLLDTGKLYLHTWKKNQIVVINNIDVLHGRFDLVEKGGNPNLRLIRENFMWKGDELVKTY